MLLNYLRLSFRLMARNPFFTAINVGGLAIGFASFYILWQYAITELKSDQFHKDADRMARVGHIWQQTDENGNTTIEVNANNGASIVSSVKEDFPEIESTLRILNQAHFVDGETPVNHDDKIGITIPSKPGVVFKEEKVVYADSNLFTFFTLPLIYGNPANVLKDAGNVVLSQSTSVKYFGNTDPTGELLKLNDSITLKVSGVYADIPHNSHLIFDMVISNVNYVNKWQVDRASIVFYLKFKNDTDFKAFETRLNKNVKKYWSNVFRLFPNVTVDFYVQPLVEIPFGDKHEDVFPAKSKPFLISLAFIAVSVLVMAWINYVNLSVVRLKHRFKEVATRKVSGGNPWDMAKQFLTESLVINVTALLLAITFIHLAQLPVSTFFDIPAESYQSPHYASIALLSAVFICGVFISGLYPSLISGKLSPRAIFNQSRQSSGVEILTTSLTTAQISLAIVFILFGFVIASQLNYVLSLNTGINKQEVIIVDAPVLKPANYFSVIKTFKTQLLSTDKNIEDVSLSSGLFDVGNKAYDATFISRTGSPSSFVIDKNYVDENFLSFYGIKLIAGRNFIKDNPTNQVLISRKSAERLGYANPNDALNINIAYRHHGLISATVIGVFEDYRLSSVINLNRTDTESGSGRGIMLAYTGTNAISPERLSLRMNTRELHNTLGNIEKLYNEQFPGNPFVWYFLDDHLNKAHLNEKTARNQVMMFTFLAIGIACLGLLGMISNKVMEKTKEIGIRKVLGAQLHQIAQILLSTTVRQVIVASFVGIPIAWYLAQQYLLKFSERIELQWWHFALPVAILIMIMLSTIASVVWKAAKSNPVEALKYE